MAREKKETVIELTPKSEAGKKRMSYHGAKWFFRGEVESIGRGVKLTGPFVGCRSRDGKAILWIKKDNDPDFSYRVIL